jgi:hypothetical protein
MPIHNNDVADIFDEVADLLASRRFWSAPGDAGGGPA